MELNAQISTLQKKNLAYNWHPYTQHQTAPAPIVMVKGKDALLWDEHGKEYIDAIGSWWSNPHGHANTYIANAISNQLNTLEHVLFGGFTHPAAIELSEKLLEILPGEQAKVFYSDNGSTAIEVGVKMALQYYHNLGQKKDCVIAFEGAFHGDTFGAMAASGIDFFTQNFQEFFLKVHRIPVPTQENFTEVKKQLLQIIETHNPAAFVFEPLVQGAAGMRMYEASFLDELVGICKAHEVLTLADEVMTGFGRTGKMFASAYLQNTPDMLAMSKALTGGFIPMAVTTCTQKIYDAFLSDDTNKSFFHGHTFMANPAGCAAAKASLELTLSDEVAAQMQQIHEQHLQFAQKLTQHAAVAGVGVKGIILRFEIKTDEDLSYYGSFRQRLYDFFISQGILTRPIGNVVYVLPPYCITQPQLDRVYEVLQEAVNRFGKED